jgi:DNA-binding NtrC family response regulator
MHTPDYILIVSQKQGVVDSYSSALREMGYKVHSTKNVHEALDFIQIREYALVMINLEHPRETDIGYIAWMRSLRRKLPILLIISKAPIRLIPKFERIDLTDYLSHPAKGKQLTTTVQRLVHTAALRF